MEYLEGDLQTKKPIAKRVDVKIDKKACLGVLKTRFGHLKFREGQWDAIKSILSERHDTFLSMPAASGKSLCYQFPSVFCNTITVVICLSISGMQGEVRDLKSRNVRACYLGSSQENSADVLEGIKDGQYNIVYATPEYIGSDVGQSLLITIRERLTLIAVDEVGANCGPEYTELHKLRDYCPGVPILTVTATGSPTVRDSVIKRLRMNDVQVISKSLNSPNLEFVTECSNNVPFLDPLRLDKTWNDIGPYIKDVEGGSIIVECIHQRDSDFLANLIRSKDYPCASCHEGVELSKLLKQQNDFEEGVLRIICKTTTLAMSFKEPDVRLVILYGMSKNLYQEKYFFGCENTARDRLPSKCVIFYK